MRVQILIIGAIVPKPHRPLGWHRAHPTQNFLCSDLPIPYFWFSDNAEGAFEVGEDWMTESTENTAT